MSRGRREADGQAMSRRLVQLVVCLGLFATVYVSKQVFPHKLQRLGENVSTLVGTTTDLRGAFSDLGESLTEGDSIMGDLGAFCVEVFGGTESEAAVPVSDIVYPTLNSSTDAMTREMLLYHPNNMKVDNPVLEKPKAQAESEPKPTGMPVGEVYIAASGNLRSLPAGYTYDMLSLGNMERTTPVMGVISSPFGYRNHPLSGSDTVHNGVDIAGDIGEPIHAFGAGTVEYIGESDIYGLYFRIDHGNGVSSFYAHCSELDIHKGDTVEVGQVVAKVGNTGNVTGSHLHLELRCNNILIDPALYIESL